MNGLRGAIGLMLLLGTTATAVGQDLDLDQLQPGPPAAFAPAPPRATGGPFGEGQPRAARAAAGASTYGYQFQYGSFSVEPGDPPVVHGIFVMRTQQFPQGSVQKLYNEELTYVGSIHGGPLEGAVFEATMNGVQRYVLFGTTTQGVQNGIPLRRVRFFNAQGGMTFSTLARFYTP